MIRTSEYIIPATVVETGEEVMVNNPAECSDNPWGFYSESWHFTKDGRVFHDDELEFRKFKKGDAVVITSMKAGGEIVNSEREDGLIEVKVANMHIDGSSVKTKIENVLVKEDDIFLITKKSGVVVI